MKYQIETILSLSVTGSKNLNKTLVNLNAPKNLLKSFYIAQKSPNEPNILQSKALYDHAKISKILKASTI